MAQKAQSKVRDALRMIAIVVATFIVMPGLVYLDTPHFEATLEEPASMLSGESRYGRWGRPTACSRSPVIRRTKCTETI